MSHGNQLNNAGIEKKPAAALPDSSLQMNSQQQPHRRTQSLRPLSAFQPLEHPDGNYQLGGGSTGGANGQRPTSPTGSVTKSIRTAAAPLTFKSPELRSALGLQEAQNKKIYMEGYLSRRDHLNAEGKPLSLTDPKKRWHLCFVQLSGTVLSVWGVQQMEEAARQGTEVPPSYINITDCVSSKVNIEFCLRKLIPLK
jgi:CCR4-NOT transcriptional complex subunit CAF120